MFSAPVFYEINNKHVANTFIRNIYTPVVPISTYLFCFNILFYLLYFICVAINTLKTQQP